MCVKQQADAGLAYLTEWISKSGFLRKTLKKGDFVLRQGQQIDQLYWLSKGTCTVNYTAANGRRYSHGRFGPGDRLYGEIEFLNGRPVQFDICCDEDAEVVVIPPAALATVMQEQPNVIIWLAQCMAETYHHVTQHLTNQFMFPLAYSIAKDLLERELGNRPAVQFDKVFREAERFGCSERVYRRAVNQLIDLELVEKTNSLLRITDIERLKRYLEEEER
ncbi:Crp/Fnr family transcriptional regulator [Pseudovibrio sp. SPO723]|uniref:Crp/Fnr family transcriptional regulator n=1 Tax=Nesiotobacter zosterae TaxID=392721 RepID=UPI0029C3DB4F|nr:Crp/Fnr family transcriptional regulator [Pseudovibrio sp. SPO723]MDX5593271.1 Crp/Fnr family transcriptional regulator [Pseudovibrio sp. SPO723]